MVERFEVTPVNTSGTPSSPGRSLWGQHCKRSPLFYHTNSNVLIIVIFNVNPVSAIRVINNHTGEYA
jgi:hypothetical protein